MIGVAVTTHNRPQVAHSTIQQWKNTLPEGAVLVIVDDASITAYPGATHRFTENVGIARAKNKGIELLMAAGCEHLFLADDDCAPINRDWWQPYVNSPEPHLMNIFTTLRDPSIIASDGRHTAYTHPRGHMLYAHRTVIDQVGGMDPVFGRWGHEHVDWSTRIHNAGLTTWRFADVTGGEQLIHCLDADGRNRRSIPKNIRDEELARNTPVLAARSESSAYVEYREQVDAVVTVWLDGLADTQHRLTPLTPTPLDMLVAPLRASIRGAELTVLSNSAGGDTPITVLPEVDMYLQRWIHIRQWLRDHPEVRYVYAVDAGDVTMLHEPWPVMIPGKLYVGWEPKIIDDPWMRGNFKARALADFIHGNRDTLLNPTIGGDRATVMEFCNRMTRLVEDNARDRHDGLEQHTLGNDMGAVNYVAYTHFEDRLVTGPGVATVFKTYQGNEFSFWRHK